MRTLFETLGGLLELLRLGWITRFRLRGEYWTWRRHTAFGDDPAQWPSLRERMHATLEYGRWVHRMRRRLRG